MVDLNRQIRATQARQGGFSAHVLPGAVGYEPASFIFAPQLVNGQWQLTDGTPVLPWKSPQGLPNNPLDATFQALGGPGGRDAVRHTPYFWGGFQTEEDPKFSALSSVAGLTIDGWIFFAPMPDPSTSSGSPQRIAWGLTRSKTLYNLTNQGIPVDNQAFVQNLEPSIYLQVNWNAVDFNGRVNMFLIYQPATGSGGGSGSQFVISNSESFTGWHHYAVEYAANGDYVLFFDGQPVKSGNTLAPDMSQMRVMHGSWVFSDFSVNTSGTRIKPEYIDMSYLRCRYSLPYRGQAFTP